jgi:glycosyltransferase involved in cell wall biosynthesis
MNILLTNSTDIYAGGEFYVLELARMLLLRGYRMWVACRPHNLLRQKCKEAGIPCIPVDFPTKGQLASFVALLRNIIREHEIQIVHTNSNYDRTAGAFAARLTGASHVTNVHSFHSLRHNITHAVRNALLTDHFIVDGACVKDLLVHHDGIPARKVTVIHLGVNPDWMKKDEALRAVARTSFGYEMEDIVIGNVARLVPFKGQEYLLRAFTRLLPRYPTGRLLLVGDGELRDSLVKIADQLGVREAVTFAGFRDDLQAVYCALDIYVHPSVEGGGETFPFAVLQAMAQELPLIVTRVGDVAEMVREGINGFVVPDKDEAALAEKLDLLLGDPAMRARKAAQSRKFLLEKFTVARMVSEVEQVYSSLHH